MICRTCLIDKDADAFNATNRTRLEHGRWGTCKECVQTYNTRYYATHREAMLAYEKAKRDAMTEGEKKARNMQAMEWSHSNPEKRQAISKRYYENHKEAHNKRVAAWKSAHPDRVRQICVKSEAKKRARSKNDPLNDLTVEQWREIIAAYDSRCVYCHTKLTRPEMDHITPLSKGGSNTASNVVPCCTTCNREKYTGPVLKPVQPLLLTLAPSQKKNR